MNIIFYLFKGLQSFTIIISFNGQIVPDLANEVFIKLSSVSFCHVSTFFKHFLASWNSKMFQTYTSASALESGFFQVTPVAFSGEWYVETRIWALGMLIATGISLFSDPFKGQSKGIYVHVHVHVHVYVYIYHMHIYLRPFSYVYYMSICVFWKPQGHIDTSKSSSKREDSF